MYCNTHCKYACDVCDSKKSDMVDDTWCDAIGENIVGGRLLIYKQSRDW